ncbi:MAG TPA: DUF6249 domain-containing protein [Ktedonobacteraceae bacterium]|nr:DUF6249 domain-containing protein [Ktedonobacteraceae bacterium]
MPSNVIIVLIGWLVALAIFFGFIVLLRYLQHREHMAMISTGIHPDSLRPPRRRSRGMLRAGLIISMVGLTLTIGLYPIGYILPPVFAAIPFHFGPWLLPGLIPLGVGIALTTSYYLERDAPPSDTESKERISRVKEARSIEDIPE